MYGLALGQYTILAWTPQSVNFHIALKAMFYVNCRSIVKHTLCVICKAETKAVLLRYFTRCSYDTFRDLMYASNSLISTVLCKVSLIAHVLI